MTDNPMNKVWCTTGCVPSRLWPKEEFAVHQCVVREKERQTSRGYFVMSDDQVARDQRIGTEYDTPLRPITEAVEKVMESSPREAKPSLLPKPMVVEEDPDDAQVFSIYKNLRPEIVDFFVSRKVRMGLRWPPRKEEKSRSFCQEFNIPIPDDMVSTAPFVDGRGPLGGVNETWTLTGWIEFAMPEDEAELDIFNSIDNEYRKHIKVKVGRKGQRFGLIRDTKLNLTLLALRPDAFKIDSYPKLLRRRPRKDLTCS